VIVVKVGGSLFDWPELGACLGRWLRTVTTSEVLLVPGGGALADVVRDCDRVHGLGEEKAHWLALGALALQARVLSDLLPGAEVAADLVECARVWRLRRLPILDALCFARDDEGRPGHLPHCWSVTSDSVAARVAVVAGAERLVLLKSVSMPGELDAEEAARQGVVDSYFPRAIRSEGMHRPLPVQLVNLRAWPE
jgi:5-(aminomethyl)-3-furanmethanol phosphate kinase